MIVFLNSQSPKVDIELLNARRFLMFIDNIISTNTKLIEAYFLLVYPVRSQWLFTHHVNLGSFDPIIRLTIPSSASPICTEMVQKSLIFNSNLQEQVLLDYNQVLKLKQEWDKLIADKKSLMTIIFEQCVDATKTKIVLGASYEDNLEAGKRIKFFTRVHIVYNRSNN